MTFCGAHVCFRPKADVGGLFQPGGFNRYDILVSNLGAGQCGAASSYRLSAARARSSLS